MNKLFRLLVFFIVLTWAGSAGAELKLPSIFGDHMVLQRGNPTVWGWAKARKKITVSMAGQAVSAKTGKDGKWKVQLASLTEGGPYDLVVSGDGSVTVTDVLVGDVWLGSGQSNMEFAMRTSHDADVQIPKADIPQMRLFTVERVASSIPQDDLNGSWKVCTPDNAKDFSAVAYHFGMNLQKSLKIPIGMIVSCWGGTAGECWTPQEALEKDPVFTQVLQDWQKNTDMVKVWTEGSPYELDLSDIYLVPKGGKGEKMPILLENGGKGLGGSWFCTVKPGSTGTYAVTGTGPQNGPAASLSGLMKGGDWITLTANLQAGAPAADLSAYDSIEFYAKGKGQFRMKLDQASIADYDYYSTDVFNASPDWQKLTYPLSSLKQGGWGAAKPFTQNALQNINFAVEIPYWPDIASVAYNAMIAPLTPLDITGVIWYQGESNTGRAADYHELLSTLIQSWRTAWGKEFPFLIVQLPNYMQVKPEPSESSWAELRESQLKTLDVPHTAVVTTIDLGEAGNIHPKNKTEVGRRLSLAALDMVYQTPTVSSGPLLDHAVVQDGKMILTFKDTGKGLATRDDKPVTGFAVSDQDGDFHWAQAKITGENTIEVWSDDAKPPVEVRYAWADNPVCNLINKDGLPASPFRYSTLPSSAAKASPFFETWKSVDATNTGVYVDTKGSKFSYTVENGPKKGQKALRLVFNLKEDGFCGLWHNGSYDLSKAGTIAFQAKTSVPGEVQIALKDRWNVQYSAKAAVSSADWEEVDVPITSFIKDRYYSPPDAQEGHFMDLSQVKALNIGPQSNSDGELWVGPVSAK